jgi:hypothetical protein
VPRNRIEHGGSGEEPPVAPGFHAATEGGPGEGAVADGFWFGGDVKACWRGVYASYELDALRREEDELWAERERLAEAGPPEPEALEPILLRIALVEDRLRELIGRYS